MGRSAPNTSYIHSAFFFSKRKAQTEAYCCFVATTLARTLALLVKAVRELALGKVRQCYQILGNVLIHLAFLNGNY